MKISHLFLANREQIQQSLENKLSRTVIVKLNGKDPATVRKVQKFINLCKK